MLPFKFFTSKSQLFNHFPIIKAIYESDSHFVVKMMKIKTGISHVSTEYQTEGVEPKPNREIKNFT